MGMGRSLASRYSVPMKTDFSLVSAAPRASITRGEETALRRRRHARKASVEAALWAGRIAEHLGAEPGMVGFLRRATRAQAFARGAGLPVPRWARVSIEWEAAVGVAVSFAEALSPLDGAPALPKALLREFLQSPIASVSVAGEALAAYFGIVVTPALLPTVEWERFEAARRDLAMMTGTFGARVVRGEC